MSIYKRNRIVEDTSAMDVPVVGNDLGISSLLTGAITESFTMADYFNSIIATVQEKGGNQEVLDILNDVANETHITIGKLQKALELISPNAIAIDTGKQKAENEIMESKSMQRRKPIRESAYKPLADKEVNTYYRPANAGSINGSIRRTQRVNNALKKKIDSEKEFYKGYPRTRDFILGDNEPEQMQEVKESMRNARPGMVRRTSTRRLGERVEPDFYEPQKPGMEYWYYTRHGLGPGMLPKNVEILDVYEDSNFGTYFKTNKILSTRTLREYEIEEKAPKFESYRRRTSARRLGEGRLVNGRKDIVESNRTRYNRVSGGRVVESTPARRKPVTRANNRFVMEGSNPDIGKRSSIQNRKAITKHKYNVLRDERMSPEEFDEYDDYISRFNNKLAKNSHKNESVRFRPRKRRMNENAEPLRRNPFRR